MFLKNRNIISKIKRSKVTDYAALMHKSAMGLDTSYDNIISSSFNTVNGVFFITHFDFKYKYNPSLERSILMYIPFRNNLTHYLTKSSWLNLLKSLGILNLS